MNWVQAIHNSHALLIFYDTFDKNEWLHANVLNDLKNQLQSLKKMFHGRYVVTKQPLFIKKKKYEPFMAVHCSLLLYVTTHQLSIQHVDWPKLHDIFKGRDAKTGQREFPVGFPVEVCALNSLFIYIFHNVVACKESRDVIKAKHVCLIGLLIRSILHWKMHSR